MPSVGVSGCGCLLFVFVCVDIVAASFAPPNQMDGGCAGTRAWLDGAERPCEAMAALAEQPLTTQGHRGAWSEQKGDMQYLVSLFNFDGGYQGVAQVCDKCRASKSIRRLFYTDVSPTAAHRRTVAESICCWLFC